MIELQVLICTIGEEGIRRVVNTKHPIVNGVEYLVSWQQPDKKIDIPEELTCRNDIKVCITQSKGICKNRNHAIECASAPICLMSDDDVDYEADELNSLIHAFKDNPDTDLITIKYRSERHQKIYPEYSFDLRKPAKGYYVTCFEIAFRLHSVKNRVKFNENISLGTPVLRCGEEDVFIHDAKHQGLNMIFIPITVGTHNHPTTGDRDLCEPYFWMTKGAVFSYIFKISWIPRIIVNAWRTSRKTGKSVFYFIRHGFAGVAYARKHNVFKK